MGRNKLCVYIHFVWATWDREPFITPDIERRLHRLIETISCDNGCEVLAVNGMEDHMHLFVKFPATITMAHLMKEVKGGSSRRMTEEIAPHMGFKWQGSYGAFSISPAHRKKIIAYIENQKQHHASNDLLHEAEETTEHPDLP